MIQVLVVEDELSLRGDLEDYLSAKGYRVMGAATLAESRAMLEQERFDAAIVDIGLPDGDGLGLVERIRQHAPQCGIVVLTAFGEPEARVRGLESGADAYLVKRATLREIDATLRSVLRRVSTSVVVEGPVVSEWLLDRGDWSLVAPNGLAVRLTSTEMAFLIALAENKGNVCQREQLAQSIGRAPKTTDERNLDAVVRRLRRKISETTGSDVPIKVVYGVGYAFPASLRCVNEGR
ncbi:MAG: response regulator transcription factor [Magnetococcales bacterium]|nr:response regulator transcription factor [Magnetococcales bacterium]